MPLNDGSLLILLDTRGALAGLSVYRLGTGALLRPSCRCRPFPPLRCDRCQFHLRHEMRRLFEGPIHHNRLQFMSQSGPAACDQHLTSLETRNLE